MLLINPDSIEGRAYFARKAAEAEKSIEMSESTWNEFMKSIANHGLINAYAGEALTGGFYFRHEQIMLAESFLMLAVRDRGQLQHLESVNYSPDSNNNFKLNMNLDEDIIDQLKKEGPKFGLNHTEYIRAIFYTTLCRINRESESLQKEQRDEWFDSLGNEVKGKITTDLRKRLEAKYGKPRYNHVLQVPVETYFDLLVRAAEEWLQVNVPVRAQRK